MQTFKHKTISGFYRLHDAKYTEWVSVGGGSANIHYADGFFYLSEDDFIQCPESEYLRAREEATHFLNEHRPRIVGASKYLNKTTNPLTAE